MDTARMIRTLRELRLRRPSDTIYRLYRTGLAKSGLLRKQFAAGPARRDEFLRALKPGVATSLDGFVNSFDHAMPRSFYFDHRASVPLPAWLQQSESENGPLLESANAVVQRRFQALGSLPVQFDKTVDWHHCLNHDRSWPRAHWIDIDISQSEFGDVKSCWEWNRHACFVTLGRAYRATGDERFVDTFVDLLSGWCEQNPPEIGVHYTSNLELGLRIVAWLWAHHLMYPSERYTARHRGLLHLNLYYMARHIANNLQYTEYTGRNNHLIGDASCLAVYCLMYPEVRATRRWLERAQCILWKAAQTQILEDGMHFELSFGYHQFVLEFYLQVILLMRHRSFQVPARVLQRVTRMFGILDAFIQPDGEMPNFNDVDDGVVWPLHDTPSQRTKSLLEIGTAVFGQSPREEVNEATPTEQAYWLLDRHSVGLLTEPTGAQRNDESVTKDEARQTSGLFAMRSGWHKTSHFALINNHPDPFPNSGHNHACQLQLLLWCGGEPVFIDGGTFRYNADEGYRNALRGTYAHNTLVIDGSDQAIPSRNFGWLTKQRPSRTTYRETEDYAVFDGLHNSYLRRFKVRHRRMLVWVKDPCLWIVRDEVSGSGQHQFEQCWHFPGDRKMIEKGRDQYRLLSERGTDVCIQLLMPPEDRVELVVGDKQRKWSWESPRYGHLRPRQSLIRRWEGAVPTARYSVIIPMKDQDDRLTAVKELSDQRLDFGDGLIEIQFGAEVTIRR